jgi:glutaredoxin
MSTFNKLLAVVFIGLGGCLAWGKLRVVVFPLEPIYQKPYVIVYGRDNCGFTQALRRDLDSRGVLYVYEVIDENHAHEEIVGRIRESGLSEQFTLPAVDVNAEILLHPSSDDVARKYGPVAAKAG